jgi:hypothetical protein
MCDGKEDLYEIHPFGHLDPGKAENMSLRRLCLSVLRPNRRLAGVTLGSKPLCGQRAIEQGFEPASDR